MDDSAITQNPHPTQGYQVKVSIKDAPGPFESVKAVLSFQVSNGECVPKDPFSGAKKIPTHYPVVALTPLEDGSYSGTIYLDLLQDSDYFGMGTCHWKVGGLIVTLAASNRTYGARISARDIQAQQSDIRYIPERLYSRADIDGLNYPAGPWDDDVAASPMKFFSITLTAKERHDGQRME